MRGDTGWAFQPQETHSIPLSSLSFTPSPHTPLTFNPCYIQLCVVARTEGYSTFCGVRNDPVHCDHSNWFYLITSQWAPKLSPSRTLEHWNRTLRHTHTPIVMTFLPHTSTLHRWGPHSDETPSWFLCVLSTLSLYFPSSVPTFLFLSFNQKSHSLLVKKWMYS